VRKIVYYVASSIDGFICRPDHSIEGFVGDGSAVSKYLEDLKTFDTVLMGRKTYEFGYKYGLEPGSPPYPHMQNYIFSKSLRFENQDDCVKVHRPSIDIITSIKKEKGTDIYLCGGGQFAGWLLENEQIDILKLKLNPLVLGDGIRLFGHSKKEMRMQLMETQTFDKGVQIMTYNLHY
jgi:dihydrofolate reductase